MTPRACDDNTTLLSVVKTHKTSSSHHSQSSSSTSLCSSTSNASLSQEEEDHVLEAPLHHEDETKKKYWWIHGQAYDLDEFVERHPGGKEAILLGKGRDCTALVESYHPFQSYHVFNVLQKFQKQTVHEDSSTDSSSNNSTLLLQLEEPRRDEDFFYRILKERVATVLHNKGIDPIEDRAAPWYRTLYYAIVFAAWLMTGYGHVTGKGVLVSFGFAIFGWFMGALGHDAGHFSASRYVWVNEWGVWAMGLICNPIQWQQQHTYAHHSFTNEFDRDPDIHHFDLLLRVHRKIALDKPIFRYQVYTAFIAFVYAFVVFGTCVWIPWGVIETGAIYDMVEWHDKDRWSKAIGMRLHLALYTLLIIIAPFWTSPTCWQAIGAVVVHIATLGITFGIFSQVNHMNELSMDGDLQSMSQRTATGSFRQRRDQRLVGSWAAAQVETSNNFATGSQLWHVLSNGLNHQIEHHLFPGLNHSHLHHIAPVVKQTCEEYDVHYKSFDSWKEVMSITLQWYSALSGVDQPQSVSDERLVFKSKTP